MLRAVTAAGRNYVPPERHYVGGAGLLECKQRIEKALSPVTRSWRETGVTIASDMMQDKGSRAQMNIICINDTGAVFIEAVNCKAATKSGLFIVGVLRPIIERIGAEHVVALCIDGGSNYKAAGKLLQKEWPHLDLVPCATHVLDLLMEDIGKMDWAQVVVTKPDNMISFVRGNQWTRAFMRSPEVHGEEKLLQVLRSAGTRFGTQFIAVSRLRAVLQQLTAMVTHKDWAEKGWNMLTGSDFEGWVMDSAWWKKVDVFVQVMELLYNVMRMTDSAAKGMMGQLYDNMLQLMEELEAAGWEGLEEDGEVEVDEDDVCFDEWEKQEEQEKQGEEEEEEEEEEEDERRRARRRRSTEATNHHLSPQSASPLSYSLPGRATEEGRKQLTTSSPPISASPLPYSLPGRATEEAQKQLTTSYPQSASPLPYSLPGRATEEARQQRTTSSPPISASPLPYSLPGRGTEEARQQLTTSSPPISASPLPYSLPARATEEARQQLTTSSPPISASPLHYSLPGRATEEAWQQLTTSSSSISASPLPYSLPGRATEEARKQLTTTSPSNLPRPCLTLYLAEPLRKHGSN
ncbi:unnamed protein product [Closterium sp. Naga37s-1]|nr:unnamed protein product [Closterium sp. Naga37s-1]